MSVSTILTPVASILDSAAPSVPGVGGTVMRALAAASRFIVDIAAQGLDPVKHIERLHAADPALKGVRSEWKQKLDELYGDDA